MLCVGLFVLEYLVLKMKRFDMLKKMPQNVQLSSVGGHIYIGSQCDGRIGNLLSTLATLYSYEKRYGFEMMLYRKQAWPICYYFECTQMLPILEKQISDWSRINIEYYNTWYVATIILSL